MALIWDEAINQAAPVIWSFMVLFKSMSFTPYWRGYNFEINTQNIYIIVNIQFFVIKLRIKSSLYLLSYNFYYIMHYIECPLPTIIAQLSCFISLPSRSFKETLKTLQSTKPFTTKLSSAGLVYFHFGRTVIAQTLRIKEEDVLTEKMFDKIYENFIQEIDAIDNGINQTEDEPR